MVVFGPLRSADRVVSAITALETRHPYSIQSELRISYNGSLHANNLALLLRKMRELKRIFIINVTIEGTLTEVSEAFSTLHELKSITFNCTFHGEEATSSIQLLGSALAKLKVHSIDIHPKLLSLLESIVTTNEFNSSATLLCDGVRENQIYRCFPIIEKSRTLKYLTLTGRYELKSKRCIEALGELIRNSRSLVRLRLLVNPEVSLIPVAEALKYNKTLKQLTFWSSNLVALVDYSDLSLFLKVLQYSNFTLRSLQVRPVRWVWKTPTKEAEEALKLHRSIDFYCLLNHYTNRNGIAFRESLLSLDASIEDLLEALCEKKLSISVIYHLCRMNPSIWLRNC